MHPTLIKAIGCVTGVTGKDQLPSMTSTLSHISYGGSVLYFNRESDVEKNHRLRM